MHQFTATSDCSLTLAACLTSTAGFCLEVKCTPMVCAYLVQQAACTVIASVRCQCRLLASSLCRLSMTTMAPTWTDAAPAGTQATLWLCASQTHVSETEQAGPLDPGISSVEPHQHTAGSHQPLSLMRDHCAHVTAQALAHTPKTLTATSDGAAEIW
jgi:hypothetical protein